MKKYSGENFSHTLRAVMGRKTERYVSGNSGSGRILQCRRNLGYLDKEMQIHILDRYLKEQARKSGNVDRTDAKTAEIVSQSGNTGKHLFCDFILVIRRTVKALNSYDQKRKGRSLEVGLIFKIGAVGILVSVLGQVLKHIGREEQAFLTSLAGLIVVLFWVLPYIYQLFETIKKLFTL